MDKYKWHFKEDKRDLLAEAVKMIDKEKLEDKTSLEHIKACEEAIKYWSKVVYYINIYKKYPFLKGLLGVFPYEAYDLHDKYIFLGYISQYKEKIQDIIYKRGEYGN